MGKVCNRLLIRAAAMGHDPEVRIRSGKPPLRRIVCRQSLGGLVVGDQLECGHVLKTSEDWWVSPELNRKRFCHQCN